MTYQEFIKLRYPNITLASEIVPLGTVSTPHIEDCESLHDTSFNLLLDSHPDCTPVSRDSSFEYVIDEYEGYNLEDYIF